MRKEPFVLALATALGCGTELPIEPPVGPTPVCSASPTQGTATFVSSGRSRWASKNTSHTGLGYLPPPAPTASDTSTPSPSPSATPSTAPEPAPSSPPPPPPDPTKERLVFAAPSCDNTTTDIFVGSTDGSTPVALTSTPDHEEIYPRWSPDHRSIAFLRDSILHVMNADGTQVRDLGVKVGPLAPPSWSPDGTKLVYAHEPPPCFHEESYGNYCASELRTYDVVTGSDTLFRRGTLLTEPEWLRTGEVVAFSSCLVENCPGNWTAMSETSLGGLYTGLPPYPTYRSYLAGHGVTVSADNRRLALVVSEPWDIWTYEQPGPLYTCFLSTCENYVPELDTRLPRWSPGGERLAYVRDDGIWVTPVAKGVPAVPSHVYAASRVRGLDW